MLMPTIGRYMTRQPWTITSRSSAVDAVALMRDHSIRHLPVVDGDKLVGIVSAGDLKLLASIGQRTAPVREAMTGPVFSVTSGAQLDEVARMMSEHKYGSAVVVTNNDKVEGIFTMVDACRALADMLERAVG